MSPLWSARISFMNCCWGIVSPLVDFYGVLLGCCLSFSAVLGCWDVVSPLVEFEVGLESVFSVT